MDVDRSIQTRQIDYQNRPRYTTNPNFVRPTLQLPPNKSYPGANYNYNQTSKRPPSQNTHQPNKVQRVFYTEAGEFASPEDTTVRVDFPDDCYEENQTYQPGYESENIEVEQTDILNDNINFLD